jgi:hypothetical protein
MDIEEDSATECDKTMPPGNVSVAANFLSGPTIFKFQALGIDQNGIIWTDFIFSVKSLASSSRFFGGLDLFGFSRISGQWFLRFWILDGVLLVWIRLLAGSGIFADVFQGRSGS